MKNLILSILFLSSISSFAGESCTGINKTGSQLVVVSDLIFVDDFSKCNLKELGLYKALLQDRITSILSDARKDGYRVDQSEVIKYRTLLNSVNLEIY